MSFAQILYFTKEPKNGSPLWKSPKMGLAVSTFKNYPDYICFTGHAQGKLCGFKASMMCQPLLSQLHAVVNLSFICGIQVQVLKVQSQNNCVWCKLVQLAV